MNALSQKGVNHEILDAPQTPGLSDEKSAPRRQFGMFRVNELLEALFVLEKIDKYVCRRGWQAQLAVDLFAQVAQILEDRLVAANLDVRKEHELRHAQRVFARRARVRVLAGPVRR